MTSIVGHEYSFLGADGPRSRIQLPALTSLVGSTRSDRVMTIRATEGGLLDLSALDSIAPRRT